MNWQAIAVTIILAICIVAVFIAVIGLLNRKKDKNNCAGCSGNCSAKEKENCTNK